MAKRRRPVPVDDLDGSEAQGPIEFGIDGELWEINLSGSHQRELIAMLWKFVLSATPRGGYKLGGEDHDDVVPLRHTQQVQGWPVTPTEAAGRAREAREWARERGIYIHSSGRVPKKVMKMFEASRQAGDLPQAPRDQGSS